MTGARAGWATIPLLAAFLLAGCVSSAPTPAAPMAVSPTSLPAAISPTSASSPVPPSATPSPEHATSAPEPTPFTINGVPARILSIAEVDSFEDYEPRNTFEDTLLVVSAEPVAELNGESLQAVAWRENTSVADEKDRESPLGKMTWNTTQIDKVTAIAWVFVVSKAARSFTLRLPEGQTVALGGLPAMPTAGQAGAAPTTASPHRTPAPVVVQQTPTGLSEGVSTEAPSAPPPEATFTPAQASAEWSKFDRWGVTFEYPRGWIVGSDQEMGVAKSDLNDQLADAPGPKRTLEELGGVGSPDQEVAILLGVMRFLEPISVQTILEEQKAKTDLAVATRDVTRAIRNEQSVVAGRPAAIGEVERSNGSRIIAATVFMSDRGIQIQCFVVNSARFAEFKPVCDHALQTLAVAQ
jgi:hypothetical protein